MNNTATAPNTPAPVKVWVLTTVDTGSNDPTSVRAVALSFEGAIRRWLQEERECWELPEDAEYLQESEDAAASLLAARASDPDSPWYGANANGCSIFLNSMEVLP